MKIARPDFGKTNATKFVGLVIGMATGGKFPSLISLSTILRWLTGTESKSGFNKNSNPVKNVRVESRSMRGVSQIYPPYCALPYRANGQKCPLPYYSKMSKTRKKPQKPMRMADNGCSEPALSIWQSRLSSSSKHFFDVADIFVHN